MNEALNLRVPYAMSLGWAGHVVRIEEGRTTFKILTGTPIGKRPLGRPRCRREEHFRMDPK